MEITPEDSLENRLKPASIEDVVNIRRLEVPGVNLFRITPDDFYELLGDSIREGRTSMLVGTIATCVGGAFRSSKINDNLHQAGISLPKKPKEGQRNLGIASQSISHAIQNATVNSEGELTPEGFEEPIKNLIVCIDTQTEGIFAYKLLHEVALKHEASGHNINMNLIVMDSIESEVGNRGRRFEREFLDQD